MNRDELFWGLYQEHAVQARQHEDQRERMTALIVAICAAALAFVGQDGLERSDLLLSVALLPLGIFGALFSRKHYERNRLHALIARTYVTEIDAGAYGPRSRARKEHQSDKDFGWTSRLHLHWYWEATPLLVSVLGIALSIVIGYRT